MDFCTTYTHTALDRVMSVSPSWACLGCTTHVTRTGTLLKALCLVVGCREEVESKPVSFVALAESLVYVDRAGNVAGWWY